MTDSPDDTVAEQRAADADADTDQTQDEDVVLDLDSATDYEQRVDELEALVEKQQQTIERQQEQLDELDDLMLDLSTRVADGNDIGVCPDCHGAVTRVNRWIRSDTIECSSCGRTFHEY